MKKYIIIDAVTSECSTDFDSEQNAREFIERIDSKDGYVILTSENYEEEMNKKDGSMKLIVAPMEYVDNKEDAEVIVDTGYCCSQLGEMATFSEDILITDILDSIDVSVKCYKE